jgi:hypothetical protein
MAPAVDGVLREFIRRKWAIGAAVEAARPPASSPTSKEHQPPSTALATGAGTASLSKPTAPAASIARAPAWRSGQSQRVRASARRFVTPHLQNAAGQRFTMCCAAR